MQGERLVRLDDPVLFERICTACRSPTAAAAAPGEDPAAFLMARRRRGPPVRKPEKLRRRSPSSASSGSAPTASRSRRPTAAASSSCAPTSSPASRCATTSTAAAATATSTTAGASSRSFARPVGRGRRPGRRRRRRRRQRRARSRNAAGRRGVGHAKFAFRSSLFSLVTLVDHLFGGTRTGDISAMAARAARRRPSVRRSWCLHVPDDLGQRQRAEQPRQPAVDGAAPSRSTTSARRSRGRRRRLLRSGVELSGKLPPLDTWVSCSTGRSTASTSRGARHVDAVL